MWYNKVSKMNRESDFTSLKPGWTRRDSRHSCNSGGCFSLCLSSIKLCQL